MAITQTTNFKLNIIDLDEDDADWLAALEDNWIIIDAVMRFLVHAPFFAGEFIDNASTLYHRGYSYQGTIYRAFIKDNTGTAVTPEDKDTEAVDNYIECTDWPAHRFQWGMRQDNDDIVNAHPYENNISWKGEIPITAATLWVWDLDYGFYVQSFFRAGAASTTARVNTEGDSATDFESTRIEGNGTAASAVSISDTGDIYTVADTNQNTLWVEMELQWVDDVAVMIWVSLVDIDGGKRSFTGLSYEPTGPWSADTGYGLRITFDDGNFSVTDYERNGIRVMQRSY